MRCPNLDGRSVLVVEDEPLIALDIATAFEPVQAHADVRSGDDESPIHQTR